MKSFLNLKKITSLILLLPSIFLLGFFQNSSVESLQTNNYSSNEIEQYKFTEEEISQLYIEQIETGANHSAAVISHKDNPNNDYLYMWGDNENNELGLGKRSKSYYTTPQKVTLLPEGDIEQISLGGTINNGGYSAAVINDGTEYGDSLYMWGNGYKGQLGVGDNHDYVTPQKVDKLPDGNIEQISTGSSHSAAIVNDGDEDSDKLYMWGNNEYGQLGDGDTNENGVFFPKLIATDNVEEIDQISLGGQYSMLLAENEIYSSGLNGNGQLGDGTKINTSNSNERFTKVDFSIFDSENYNIEQIAAGRWNSAAVVNDGSSDKLYTWGNNEYGQLGLESFGGEYLSPQLVPFFSGESIKQISLGENHSAAVVENEETDFLYTWGRNDKGQLGIDSFDNTNTPQEVSTLSSNSNKYNQISTGSNHTAILTSNVNNNNLNKATNEILYTWGDNTYGQLGNGKTSEQGESKPQLIRSMPASPTFSEASISEVKENTATLNFDYENGNNYLNEEYQLCSLKVEDANNPNLYSKTFDSNDILTNPDNNSSVNLTTLEPDTDYKLKLEGDFEIPSQSSNSQTVKYEPLIEFSTVKEEPEFTETPVVIETIDDTATISAKYSTGLDSGGDPYELTELKVKDATNSEIEYETNFDELVINSYDNQIEVIIYGLEPGKHSLKLEGTFESTLDYDAKIESSSSPFSFDIEYIDNSSNISIFFANYWYYFLTLILIIIIIIIIIMWLKNRKIKII